MRCCHADFALVEGSDRGFTVGMPTFTFGAGVLAEAGDNARDLGLRRVGLFTDARLVHGEHVAKLCHHLFTELQDLHGMTKHDAMLLQVAAILHEVGTFVSPRAHHKHSEYIILNSEIFGLDRLDINMIAMISRYHRHSGPRIDHPNYRDLDTVDRIRVAKLSALLRVADALERTHDQRVHEIIVRRDDRRLRLSLPGLNDAAVERLAMASKADLFEQVFGLEVVIDDAG